MFLRGRGSDPDGDTVAFRWTQIDGPPVILIGPKTTSPNFRAVDDDTFYL